MAKSTRSTIKLAGLCALATLSLTAMGQQAAGTRGSSVTDDASADGLPVPGRANVDAARVRTRGDVRNLPRALQNRLVRMARRPHTFLPITAFSAADEPSQLFQYYLLDTKNFQPNVFTATIPGINDGAIRTAANAANDGLRTVGSVRVTLEPKPGLPTDPADPRAFIDIFMDFSGLFVINNESGWYEGWMISDIRVPRVAPPRADGTAQFGAITPADYDVIAGLGAGNNRVIGNIFTVDGNPPRTGSARDVFPDPARQPNTVPHPVSMGAFNAQQQSDVHAYWEFNRSTNWIFPHYELPFTGGVPGTFAAGLQYDNLRTWSSAIASFQAAWIRKCCSTPSCDGPRSGPPSPMSGSGFFSRTRRRSPESTRMATASSRSWKQTSTADPMACRIRVCTCRLRRSTASRSHAKSTTACWRRASLRSSALTS